jgi:hypothetical protein
MWYLGSQYPGRCIGWNEKVVWPHPISLLPTSTCGAICRALVRPTMWLGRQYARSLTSFSGPGILGETELSYELSEMVDHLNILQSVSNYPNAVLFTNKELLIHSYVICLVFFPCCFLLPHFTKDAVWTMHLYDSFCVHMCKKNTMLIYKRYATTTRPV